MKTKFKIPFNELWQVVPVCATLLFMQNIGGAILVLIVQVYLGSLRTQDDLRQISAMKKKHPDLESINLSERSATFSIQSKPARKRKKKSRLRKVP